jgi:hypothetical protein
MKAKKLFSFATLLSIFLSSLMLPVAAQQGQNQQKVEAQSIVDEGYRLSTFEFFSGVKVSVYLPGDIASSDTISGTVSVQPGNRQVAAGGDDLSGASVEIESTSGKAPAAGGVLKFEAPNFATGGEVSLIIRSRSGAAMGRINVPVSAPVNVAEPAAPKASDFEMPVLGQTGRGIPISGPFDGDLTNTTAVLGSVPVEILAESPRQSVFRSPPDLTGEAKLNLVERGVIASNVFRNVGVQLSAGKLNLMKGETTDLTVNILGLSNLQSPLQLNLNCSGSANMQGGNQQAVQINQNMVGQGGAYVFKRTLTGTAAGVFSVTTGILAMPIWGAACLLDDKVVHVEGAPGGGDGLWIVPVTMPDGKRKNIFIKSEKKPDLKYCNWIKIKNCEVNNGTITVSDYEKTKEPKKEEPPKPKTEPKPPEQTKPVTKNEPDNRAVADQPCKDGETRNLKTVTKTFEVMTLDSKIDLTVTKSTDAGVAAAIGLSNFWKTAKKIGDKITDKLPEGSTVAGWVLAYLDRGSEVLDAVAASNLKNTAREININLVIDTKKITAACTTYEVCMQGKWARKSSLEKTERESAYSKSLKIEYGDDNWFKIAQKSKVQMLDPEKLDEFLKDWVSKQLEVLKKGEDDYSDFVKNCK